MRSGKKRLLAGLLGLLLLGCPGPRIEDCANFKDDDDDGLLDCQDPDCSAREGCDGAPCLTGFDCRGNLCLTEENNGFPSGSCSSFCDLAAPACPFGNDSACVDINLGDGRGICVDTCQQDSDCRDIATYQCGDLGLGVSQCLPGCSLDQHCTVTEICNQDNGFCEVLGEICDNQLDEDGEGLFDCQDADCASDPICDPQFLCADVPLISAGLQTGDTSSGSDVFTSACTGNFAGRGAREQIFTFIPQSPGAHSFLLESETVQGIALRKECADQNTEIGCISNFAQEAELILRPGTFQVGAPLTVIVDAFLPGQEGPFTLTITEIPPESVCNDFIDEDFDNRLDCADPDSCQGSPDCIPGSTPTGSPCLLPTDCASPTGAPACLDEVQRGFPQGYCSGFCGPGLGGCGPGALCIPFEIPPSVGLCLDTCLDDADCPTPGYSCREFDPGEKVCFPACADDAECPAAGFCNLDTGRCQTVDEICDNFLDDDQDGRKDCEDLDCGTFPVCREDLQCADGFDNDLDGLVDCEDALDCASDPSCDIDGLCAASRAAVLGENPGDTSLGSASFAGSCTGGNFAREEIFSFVVPGTPGETGILTLTLQSATDQGVYVRTDCENPESEIECVDFREGGLDEFMAVSVESGVALTIFVDGFFSPGEAGPFTLHLNFIPD